MADNGVSHRMATRPKNASTHPGHNEVQKRKRRTKEEMRIVKEQEEAAKEAKAQKKLQAAKRIGDIEKQIREAEIDKTPRPALPHTRSKTRNTTPSPLLMAESSDGHHLVSDSPPVDEYQPSCSDSTVDTVSVDEETPVKKKTRTDKPLFRDTVKEIQEKNLQAIVHDAKKKLGHAFAVADRDLAGSCDDGAVSNK